MADCWQTEEMPGAIRRIEKTQVRLAGAGLFCVILATLAVAPIQARAQTVSPQTEPAPQTTPATQDVKTLLVAPAPPAEPRFLLTGAVDLAEGYTTNAGGQQGASTNKPDSFTRGQVALGLHYTAPKLIADAHYSLTGDYYNDFHDQNQLLNQLNLTAKSELVPDHLFFNLNAFAAPAVLSRAGSLSANQAFVSNNNRQSYGYVAEPTYNLRLGDYAISQTSLNQGALFFTQPFTSSTDSAVPITSAENATSINLTERISSSPYFGPLSWGLTTFYADMNQTTQDTSHPTRSQQQSEGTGDLAYAINRIIAVTATAGYSHFDASVPLTQNPSGPIALAGVRLSYGPTFNLVAQAGTSNNFPTYLGSLNWYPTPTFKVIGSLTDTITTPQGNILSNLSTLSASPEGVFSDSLSDYWQNQHQALFPQLATVSPVPTLGLALDNSINHDRSAQLGFVHQDERTQYGLSFFGDIRDRLDVTTETTQPQSWIYGVRLNATRSLRRDLTGHAGVSYSVAKEFGGQDRIVTVDGGLTYMAAKNLDYYLTGQYLQRESNGQIVTTVPLSDFVAIVGIRRRFEH